MRELILNLKLLRRAVWLPAGFFSFVILTDVLTGKTQSEQAHLMAGYLSWYQGILALAALMIFSLVPTLEIDERVFEFFAGTPRERAWTLCRRLIAACFLVAVLLMLAVFHAAMMCSAYHQNFDMALMLGASIRPLVYLGGFSLLLAAATGSRIAALIGGALYWAEEEIFLWRLTKAAFIFGFWGYPTFPYSRWLNGAILFGGGCLFTVLAVLIYRSRIFAAAHCKA